MTDRYERIRRALSMGPTPGPWEQDGDGVSAYDEDVAVAVSCPSDAEAAFIAACDPDTIRELLDERDALREALKVLVNWIPSADTYRRLGFDPETPMRAHEAAKAALAKGEGK
jgi:hypothetical protein